MASSPDLTELARREEEILELRHECARLPGLIEEIDSQARNARELIDRAHVELEEAEKEHRSKEAELQDLEAQRGRFQNQSALVKTNAEYTALLSEIDSTTQRISATEDAILALMERIEAAQQRRDEVDREQSALEQDLQKQAQAQRGLLEQAERRLAQSEAERDALVPQLGSQVQRVYQRLAGRSGPAVARIKEGSCAACHRSVPPEVRNRVLAGDFHTCQNCMVILVPDPDASA